MASKKDRQRCICGCGRKGLQLHHAVYQQHIRAHAKDKNISFASEFDLVRDPRNLVPTSPGCHAAHHNRSRPFEVSMLPDSVFEFAAEVMGAGTAYEYLSRRYRGSDDRLDALLIRYQNEEYEHGRAA